jgi:hypothetical protein
MKDDFWAKAQCAIRIFGCALLVVIMFGQDVRAEERIALIVGNGAYASVSPLDNPVSDADLMEEVLQSKGFRVVKLTDATQIELTRGIAQFGRELRNGGPDTTGLFYYAGHAVQSFGSNFLLPVDADLTDAADLSLVAVPATAVLRQMFSAKNKTNIVILDACRNNPFEAIRDLNDNGLAEMKAPTGTLVSYSTAPGAVALDGLDGNSPFTQSLARNVLIPGLQIETVFKNVRVDVIAQTNGLQTPWETSSLTGDFFFEPIAALRGEDLAEKQMWNSVQMSTDPVTVLLFIRGFPNSVHQPEARALLSKILANELDGVASAPAETVVQEPQDEPLEDAVNLSESAGSNEIVEQEVLIASAQKSGTVEGYETYLRAFPSGIYAELALFELKMIRDSTQIATATPVPEPTSLATDVAELTFDKPLLVGVPHLDGKSIEELLGLSPMFSPFEGLPDELWKDENCSSCHEWTKQTLCTQGKTYLTANNERAVAKTHPFGGGFKQSLRGWAEAGCN